MRVASKHEAAHGHNLPIGCIVPPHPTVSEPPIANRAANHVNSARNEQRSERLLPGASTLIGKFTQHWFRHMLADNMLKAGADIRTVMAQGGWLDQKSVLGYTRDVPDYRRDKVRSLPIGDGQAGITGSKTRKG